MRVLLLDQFSDPGGAQQCLLDLLPAIRERGWQAHVGLPGEGELFERVRALGFAAEQVDCGPYRSGRKSAADLTRFARGTPRLSWQIREMAKRMDASLIYVNGPRLLPATAMAATHRPVLFHSHSYVPPGFGRKLAGVALRRTGARVVGNCRFVADAWRDYVRPDQTSVVLNGVAGPSSPPRRVQNQRAPAIGCLGRIAPEKGQREFVKAASLIHRVFPECRFYIYGSALFSDQGAVQYDAEVRAAAAGLPIEFPGWVADVYSALFDLDLLLVPSTGQEATTRVILEAFAAGVPVVAFRSGGIPEVIAEGSDGLLATSVEAMARMVVDLLSGERVRLTAMSRAARESWCSKFTLGRYLSQILEAMERCTLEA